MAYTGDKKRNYQLNWITARRTKYIERMGCCVFCGSLDSIQIHHMDPAVKTSSHIWSWAIPKLEAELRKCIALCKHCHDMMHSIMKMQSWTHGSNTAYRHGCRCLECKKAHSEINRRY